MQLTVRCIALLAASPALAFFAAGCASTGPERAAAHMISVDDRGHLVDPATGDALEGRPVEYDGDRSHDDDEQHEKVESVVQAMIAGTQREYRRDGVRRMLLYVHGGLTSAAESARQADELVSALDWRGLDPYPIFVQWHSGGLSAVWDHLTLIRQGRRRGWPWPLAAPLYFVEDVVRGVAATPLTAVREIENMVQNERPLREDAADRVKVYDNVAEWKGRVRPGDDERDAWEKAGPAGWFGRIVMLPFRAVAMPFVVGFGPPAWDDMKRRTELLFHTEEELEATRPRVLPSGGVSRLLRRLREVRTSPAHEKETWEITVVGHSMGAFAVNRILRDGSDLPITRVVYIAAACSVREYQEAVIPFLSDARHGAATVRHYVLADGAEQQETSPSNSWIEFAPRGSLLVWIDSFLSHPETRFDRTAGRFVNLITADHLLDTSRDAEGRTLRGRVSVRQYGWGAATAEPQRHEDAAEIEFWRDEPLESRDGRTQR